MLDAIMSRDWRYRYFLFNSVWSEGEMMATITNGSGDKSFLLFTEAGAILKGFDHESFMSPYAREKKELWPGLFADVPKPFANFLKEPAFSIDDTTFCIWRLASDEAWHMDEISYPDDDGGADGSTWMLQEYVEGPQAYVDFCHEYYEKEVPLDTIKEFYSYTPLHQSMIDALNHECSFLDLESDIEQIGYPVHV